VHNLVSLSGVLRSLQEADIPFVVMGGQAVGAHGASEGSRDLDIYLAAPEVSVQRLTAWLEQVEARLRYLPPLSAPVLERGHTVHYNVPFGTSSVVRLDVCTRPARIADPQNLSARAMSYTLADGSTILVMGLSDLIQTKKTQRLKDWGAIEMLLAASIATSPAPSEALVRVWLEELRDPELLQTVAAAQPSLAASVAEHRPALAAALAGDITGMKGALIRELQDGIEVDRAYQRSITSELEAMRQEARRTLPPSAPTAP
jgi:hypothetical protein